MKSYCLSILLFQFFLMAGQGVGINPTGAPPYAGAILDVHSAEKGVLLPRTLPSSILDPAEGMVIYDTMAQVFKYYSGMTWVTLLQEGAYSFWWADQDGDGFGYPFNVIYSPMAPEFYVSNNEDCDDTNPAVHAGASEICDGLDNDCDGMVDEGNPGGGAICGSNVGQCEQGVLTCVDGVLICLGEVPPQPEICDMIDNDCDGMIDEEVGSLWWPDLDNDNYGDEFGSSVQACNEPSGYADNNMDCNDLNSMIHPGAQEICDNQDNDCDGQVDETFECNDGVECTDDLCVSGVCTFVIQANKCYIDGNCYDVNETNPGNECQACVPSSSQTEWTPLAGASCNGGNGICTAAGVCQPF